MNEAEIQGFWKKHPRGEDFVGGAKTFGADSEKFFENYDQVRYQKEPHILECLKEIDFQGNRTLEIGLGQGADSEQIIKLGADWFGLDLTGESNKRVKVRLNLRKPEFGGITNASAVEMAFADKSFEIVFSHGVLHHIPEINKAQSEIHRILKPDGELIVMLYPKNSLNYRLSIAVFEAFGFDRDISGKTERDRTCRAAYRQCKTERFLELFENDEFHTSQRGRRAQSVFKSL